VAQRQRTSRRELADCIALSQVIVGGPDTVLEQVRHIRDEVGAGILDLVVGARLVDRTCIRSSCLARRICRACESFRR
jgi:hypothetical protein